MMKEKLVKHDRRQAHLSYEDTLDLMNALVEKLESSDKSSAKTFMYGNV